MDVYLTISSSEPSSSFMEINGPESSNSVIFSLKNFHNPKSISLGVTGDEIPNIQYLESLPSMTMVTLVTGDGDTVTIMKIIQDKFLVHIPVNFAQNFLNSSPSVPAGVYAYDMLRTEAGFPRSGIDVKSTESPIKASLSALVDVGKVRSKIVFGHERISNELLKGAPVRRVGLVASKYVHAGCKVLSSPHRFPIGEITSCAWSPKRGKRMCQAYIKSEYLAPGTQVLVNVPMEVPETVDWRFRKRIEKQRGLQNVFRKLVDAEIVPLS